MALLRTEYLNLSTSTVRGGPTGHGESLADMENYLLPLDRLRVSSLHGWGVGDGLRVSAASGQAGVTVSTGIALDAAGHVIALPDGGVAVVDPNADPHQLDNIPTVPVGADGLTLSTSGLSGGLLLTLTWREVLGSNQLVLLHAPWLRLLPAAGFQDTGEQVVLAQVTLDGSGLVTGLAAGPRRAVGVPAERLELRAAHAAPGPALTVSHVPAAELRARTDGGLDLNLLPSGGTPGPALSVQGGTGRVGIGTSTPAAGLEIDRGASDDLALRLASSGPGWGSGVQLANTAAGARTYGMYSGADGRWHFADHDAQADRLTIDQAGNVGIGGGTAPRTLNVKGSEIHSSGPTAGYSFANRETDTWADSPPSGERWVWYASAGLARLWSGSNGDILTISPNKGKGLALDVARRMRVQGTGGGEDSAGIWFYQHGPQADRAFVGMADDTHVGFWGNTGAQWGLQMDTTSGTVSIGTSSPDPVNRLEVHGGNSAIAAISPNLALLADGGNVGVDASGDLLAGQFNGDVNVVGRLQKGSGGFRIDHPLDPANKYLSHSFVESPEMVNLYNGTVVTDDNGEATVVLPDFFETLNRDYRYQLTPIGEVAQAAVIQEVRDNSFTIRTNKPGITVSWQVTGVRQDRWANAHRVVVEEEKSNTEQGLYLHPEVHGQPSRKAVGKTYRK